MSTKPYVADGKGHNHPGGRWFVQTFHHSTGIARDPMQAARYRTRADAREALKRYKRDRL